MQQFVKDQYTCWREELVPGLAAETVRVRKVNELDPEAKKVVEKFYSEQVEPILTPVTVDPAHPFPARLEQGALRRISFEAPEKTIRGLSGRGDRAARASPALAPARGGGRNRVRVPARHRARVCASPVSRLRNPVRRALSRDAQQQPLSARGGIAQHSGFGGHAAPSAPEGSGRAPGNRAGRRPRNHRAIAVELRAGRVAGVSGERARKSVAALQSVRADPARRI